MLGFGYRMDNQIVFFSGLIPFAFIFVWTIVGIRRSEKIQIEEGKKHKRIYAYCKICEAYKDIVSTKPYTLHKKYKLWSGIDIELECKHTLKKW